MSEEMTTDAQNLAPNAKPAGKGPVIIGLLVLVAIAGVYAYLQQGDMFTRSGTVVFVDAEKRVAELEWREGNGPAKSKEGIVHPDCKITVNGKAGTIEDIQIGDKVTAKLEYRSYKDDQGKKVREWIVHEANITR